MFVELVREVGLWWSLFSVTVAFAIWMVILGVLFNLLDRLTENGS